jgi:hypothetical protein
MLALINSGIKNPSGHNQRVKIFWRCGQGRESPQKSVVRCWYGMLETEITNDVLLGEMANGV